MTITTGVEVIPLPKIRLQLQITNDHRELWCTVVLYVVASVSEEFIASVFYAENWGGKFLWNVGNHLQDFTVS
jgi:hypothetical protein